MASSGKFWMWVPVGLLLLSLGVGTLTVILAVNDPAFAVEPDYYQRALEWDHTLAERQQSEQSGWAAEIEVHTGDLRLRLRDRHGDPVAGATVQVLAFHNARSADRHQVVAEAVEPGIYRAAIPFRRAGQWVIRFRAERGPELLIGEQRLMLR